MSLCIGNKKALLQIQGFFVIEIKVLSA